MWSNIKHFLFGKPLSKHVEDQQKLNVPLGLAVFSADALSSTAYATDEILIALAASSYATLANIISLPVAFAIVILIALVVISYRQVIKAYPGGGGAYIVAKENLSVFASHVAASALLIDYILTVSVSISAGVAAITSTGVLPRSLTVLAAIWFNLIIMGVNLRGVKESGKAFAFPAYTFLASMGLLIVIGLWKVSQGAGYYPSIHEVKQVTSGLLSSNIWLNVGFVLVFLKAFSHGCAGLTGIEAVSNGVSAFQMPAPTRANRTMSVMGILLASIFIGITFLAFEYHILPKGDETILSQVASHVFGKGTAFYFLVQISTMVMLVLAANTSFAGFPRISSMLANDGYLPRQLMNVGDRLVFSNGIIALGFLSTLLIVLFKGDTHALIPLYAIGVFVSFTLSQSGMVVHQLREGASKHRWGIFVNGFGAIVTAIVTLILAVEKFREGAWIILVAVPLIIVLFRTIKGHYIKLAKQLALPKTGYCPIGFEHTALVLVSSLSKGTIPALEYAKSISKHVEAVHINVNDEATARVKNAWSEWGCGVELTILDSPYRSITEPLLRYIDEVESRYEHNWVTIIVPEFVTKKWWHNLLHNQSAILIKTLLRFRKGKIVTTVRYFLEE